MEQERNEQILEKSEVKETIMNEESSKKNGGSKLTLIIIGIVLLVLVGYFVYSKFFTSKTKMKNDTNYEGIYGVRFKQDTPGFIGMNGDYSIYALLENGEEKLVIENCLKQIYEKEGWEIKNTQTIGYNFLGQDFINNVLYIYYGKENELKAISSILVYSIDFSKEEVALNKQFSIDGLDINFVQVTQTSEWIYFAGYENGTLGFDNKIYGYNKNTKKVEMIYDYSDVTNIEEIFINGDNLYIFDVGNSLTMKSISYVNLNTKVLTTLSTNIVSYSKDSINNNIVYVLRNDSSDVLNVFDTLILENKEIDRDSFENVYGSSSNSIVYWINKSNNSLNISGENNYSISLKEYVPETAYSVTLELINEHEVLVNVYVDYTGNNNKYYKVNLKNGNIDSLTSIDNYKDSYILLEK